MRAALGNTSYLTGIQRGYASTLRKVDCFSLILANGNSYYFNNSDVDIAFYDYTGGETSGVLGAGWAGSMVLGHGAAPTKIFKANSLRVSGLKFSSKIGCEADEQDVTFNYISQSLYAQSASAGQSGVLGTGQLGSLVPATGPVAGPAYTGGDAIEGVPFPVACREHLLDYAMIKRERAFMADWNGAPIMTVLLFYGRVADITSIGDTQAVVKVKSYLSLLDQDMPRNTYQPNCQYTLYGPGCGVDSAAFRRTGAVQAGSNTRYIAWTNTFGNPQQPSQGTLQFTSGDMNGFKVQVSYSTSTGSYLDVDLPLAPNVGDTFVAQAGCDHTYEGNNLGCAYFRNQARFRGFPCVPPPSTAY